MIDARPPAASSGALPGPAPAVVRSGFAFLLDPSGTTLGLHEDGDGEDVPPGWIYVHPRNDRVCHESDGPDAPPLLAADADRRRVRIEAREGGRLTVILLGGMNPRDFDVRLATESFAVASGARHRETADDAIVRCGLGSSKDPTRAAAQGVLIRRGEAAIPALVRGLSSRDLEVSVRCERILQAIRDGEEP